MTPERRLFTRIAFEVPGRLQTATGVIEVQVLDLSFKGALLRLVGTPAPAAHTPCELSVPLAGTEARITMQAEVAHVEGERLGLLCRGIDLDSMTHLRRLIEFNLGDPALLERELRALVAG